MIARTGLGEDLLWFKKAVFYELSVRAFHDDNNDGIGDFQGLISKLEYLEWLDRMTIGRPYRDEIDVILRQAGRRRSAARDDKPGLFRRR